MQELTAVGFETKIIHCSGFETLDAHQVWQVLFDVYRQGGGSLDDMSNMLIDYAALVEFIKTGYRSNHTLYWRFEGNFTELRKYRDCNFDEIVISFESRMRIKLAFESAQ